MKFYFWLLTFSVLPALASFAQNVEILTNHIGYEMKGPKTAVVLGRTTDTIGTVRAIEYRTGRVILSVFAQPVGSVDHWKDWHFWSVDFPQLNSEGTYFLECTVGRSTVRSDPFLIQPDLLERNTLSNVIYYFKGQRCSGLLDKADRNLPFQDSARTADVHGGWYDATGDYGKHLSHLSFSTYFNPQQIPFTDWSLFEDYAELTRRDTSPDKNFRQYRRRLLDEAMYGADYLVRVKAPGGSFYRSIDAPGGEKRPEDRRIARESMGFAIKTLQTKDNLSISRAPAISSPYPYEVGFRNGGGMAIAALARASTFNVCGDFSNAKYLQTAQEAFAFLQTHNRQLANDGKENIVDDYCALLAATELYKATKDRQYKTAADLRAENLMHRLISAGQYRDYWRADDGNRPFFHPADAGLPVVSLLNYYSIATFLRQIEVLKVVERSLKFEIRTTEEVPNPFGYARQLVQSAAGDRHTAFFFPHDTETAPWWQGENARLASLAAAARMAANHFGKDPEFQTELRVYAWNQLNWILGLNPYDACMLQGAGHNNIAYMFFKSYEYTNAPGGICNGITGGATDPHGIDFNLGFAVTGKDEDWRWGEQWLPHASWYLLAISLDH
jgi:hypothetical protein